jgi:hypothetical protein
MAESANDVGDVRLLPLRASRSALAVHTAMLSLVLLAILALVNTGQVGFPDEGIYSAQVDNLSRGSWSAVRPAQDIDNNGLWVAASGSVIVGDSYIPYARQPFYPLVLLPAFELGGVLGMLVLSTFGTVAAALAAALLARRIEPSLGIAALWLTGIGSPLLFDAYLIIGHSLAAALTGMLAVTVCAAVDDRRPVWMWAAIPLAALLTMIRSEGVLVVLALGAVVTASACAFKPRPRIDLRRGLIGAALGATALVTYLVNQRVATAILGSGSGGSIVPDRSPDAVSLMWISLLRPWSSDGRLASTEAMLMAMGTLLSVISYRALPRFRVLSLGLLVMASVSSVVLAARQPNLITGLFPVFPAAVIGLGLLERADLDRPVVGRMLAASSLVAVAILATAYGIGGASEWGGRFFHVLIPLLAGPAVLGLSHARDALPRVEFRVALAALTTMVVTIGSIAVRANHEIRVIARSATSQAAALVRSTDTTSPPAIAVSTFAGSGSSRLFWQLLGDGYEVVAPGDFAGLRMLIETAAASGRDQLVVVTDLDPANFAGLSRPTLENVGWKVSRTVKVDSSNLTLVLLGDDLRT